MEHPFTDTYINMVCKAEEIQALRSQSPNENRSFSNYQMGDIILYGDTSSMGFIGDIAFDPEGAQMEMAEWRSSMTTELNRGTVKRLMEALARFSPTRLAAPFLPIPATNLMSAMRSPEFQRRPSEGPDPAPFIPSCDAPVADCTGDSGGCGD